MWKCGVSFENSAIFIYLYYALHFFRRILREGRRLLQGEKRGE